MWVVVKGKSKGNDFQFGFDIHVHVKESLN